MQDWIGIDTAEQSSYHAIGLVLLKDIEAVRRTDLKDYCFEIVTRDKTHHIALKSDEDVYSWMDEIYNVPLSFWAVPSCVR